MWDFDSHLDYSQQAIPWMVQYLIGVVSIFFKKKGKFGILSRGLCHHLPVVSYTIVSWPNPSEPSHTLRVRFLVR